jgi:transposase
LRQALSGRFSEHHAFLISHALTELDNLEESMSALAARVEQQLVPFAQEIEQLTTIPGIKRVAAAVILSEIGTDMNCFPDTARLASWAGMAPQAITRAPANAAAPMPATAIAGCAPSWSSVVTLPGRPATPRWRLSTGA